MRRIIVRFHLQEEADTACARLRGSSAIIDCNRVPGLKTTAIATCDDGDFEAAGVVLSADPAVRSWADGDEPMQTAAMETVSFTMQRNCRIFTAENTQFLHYYDEDGKNPIPDYGSLPTDVSFERNDARLGSNLHMAMIDTGVDDGHTDEFGARVVSVSDQYSDGPGDHGTTVGSIMAGETCGFCPEAQILDVKALASGGGGGISDVTTSIGELVTWMQTGSNVGAGEFVIANMSIGTTSYDAYAGAIEDLEDEGGILFVASGNFGWNLDGATYNFWPADTHPQGCCGAVDLRRFRTHFSNYGSTVRFYGLGWHTPSADNGGGYHVRQGTSFSAPATAGAFGTWVTDKTPPTNRAEVIALQDQYFAEFCLPGTVRNRQGREVTLSHARLARACRDNV